jgi:hypothetical protein
MKILKEMGMAERYDIWEEWWVLGNMIPSY